MSDKFIMIGLDDERSKKVAHILGNKTCKKIIDFLSEIVEASEKDISDALNIPINTVEYNLNKLVDSGLVEKTKNFFWSKKGKKIPMYKVAKKHIVISPKSSPSLIALKTIIPIIAVIATAFLIFNLLPVDNPIEEVDQTSLKTFSSYEELVEFLKTNQNQGGYYSNFVRDGMGVPGIAVNEDSSGSSAVAGSSEKSSSSAQDYSETNIQVEGVDEPDIVKNDGKYIYVVSNQKIIILDAYPAEEMKILSEINFSDYVSNMFVNEDKLVVFFNDYSKGDTTEVRIYDISNKESPLLDKEISMNGYYLDARMIGDYVYVISNEYVYENNPVLPMVAVDGIKEEVAIDKISYFPYPDTSYTFTNILAVDLDDGDYDLKTYLLGASYTLYVSENNLYLTYLKRIGSEDYFEELVEKVFMKVLPSEKKKKVEEILESEDEFYIQQREVNEVVEDYSRSLKGKEKEDFDMSLYEKLEEFNIELQKRTEKTVIHKISIDKLDINYATYGEVPGRILNQFSMDEHEENFRIATTTGDTWGRADSLNHLYILDEEMQIVGAVEDLAKGERIYSVRFIEDRAYMVTFRQVDPLYVIDLSNSDNPKVLGYLKVTGYSSYLHPYDENHIIGIGKEATEEGRVQGVKIALFDVSDVANPVEKAKYEVGAEWSEQYSWSDSNALYDHKAFLFDKDKELLVLPINYNRQIGSYRDWEYWQGAYVFKINEEEISLRGRIDHNENKSDERYYDSAVQRSLYMDDTLYTISRSYVKANDILTLDEIKSVLIYEEEFYPYYKYGIEEDFAEEVNF